MQLIVPTVVSVLLAAAAPAKTPDIPFEQFKLPNGLNVILSEDRSAPIVAVDVQFDVGSKETLEEADRIFRKAAAG